MRGSEVDNWIRIVFNLPSDFDISVVYPSDFTTRYSDIFITGMLQVTLIRWWSWFSKSVFKHLPAPQFFQNSACLSLTWMALYTSWNIQGAKVANIHFNQHRRLENRKREQISVRSQFGASYFTALGSRPTCCLQIQILLNTSHCVFHSSVLQFCCFHLK